MTEVRRPAPPQTARERWRDVIERWRAPATPRVARRAAEPAALAAGGLRGGLSGGPGRGRRGASSGESGLGPGARASSGVASAIFMSLGAGLLIVAAVFAWTSWRGRSAVPLDDQLPYLLDSDEKSEAAANAGETTDPQLVDRPDADQSAGAASGEPAVEESGEAVEGAPASDGPQSDVGSSSAPTRVVVYVSGAVAEPGVVELLGEARVHHAVEAAGGATTAADLERVNLAALLVDGERIHVPEVGDDALPPIVAPSRSPEPSTPSAVVAGEPDVVRVDINRATVSELEQLPGIGPSIARSILDLRTARGAYDSVDELLLVDGIGPTKLETLRPHAFVTSN